MRVKSLIFVLEQLTLLVGIFFLLNLLFFLPDYYSMQFNTNVCDNVEAENFTTENLRYSEEYYNQACDSVLEGWKNIVEPPLTFRYHFLPAVISLLVTGFYTYYRLLDFEYRRRGWDNEG
ncbi:hypothetical protein GLU60_00965 [Nanohaloarchaea archaeon H01]|nr:hypothetical protein [Nanohaloarchaea archaeon H01]